VNLKSVKNLINADLNLHNSFASGPTVDGIGVGTDGMAGRRGRSLVAPQY